MSGWLFMIASIATSWNAFWNVEPLALSETGPVAGSVLPEPFSVILALPASSPFLHDVANSAMELARIAIQVFMPRTVDPRYGALRAALWRGGGGRAGRGGGDRAGPRGRG